jgi:hypothetical protein
MGTTSLVRNMAKTLILKGKGKNDGNNLSRATQAD